VGLTLDVAFPPVVGAERWKNRGCNYTHCGRCTEGSAQPRRQIDIMVKRVPSMVIRANSRVEQYRY
jgi:hypothetical protein